MTIKNQFPKYILIFLTLILLISVFSCKKKTVEEELPEEEIETLVVFISGEATITEESIERKAEIGDAPGRGASIKTAEDSYLELLIGKTGIIRIEGNTELYLETLFKKGEDISVGLNLLSGTVISKVNKVIQTEEYTIKTRTAAFGVRGTEFLVSASGAVSSAAVRSGSVSVSLYSDIIENIKKYADEAAADGEAYRIAAEKVEAAFPVIESGKEFSISDEETAELGTALSRIEETISLEKDSTITKEEAEKRLVQDTAAAAVSAAESVRLVRAISEDNRQRLEITDNMQIIPVLEIDKEISIRTEPAGAEIYFDGKFIGYSSVNALFRQDKKLEIRVESEGYDTYREEISVNEITESPYTIILKRTEPDKGLIDISAVPSDADIFINSTGPYRGVFRGSFAPGEEVTVSVRRAEYNEEIFTAEVEAGATVSRRIVLRPMLIPYQHDTGLEKADHIIRAGAEGYALYEEGGFLSFLSSEGENLWITEAPVTEKPVFTAGKVFAMSENRLSVYESSTGSILSGFDVAESLYRKPVLSQGNIYINSSNSVLGINSQNLNIIRETPVPDTIVSNPAFYRGNILSVTDKGVLQIMGERETPLSSIPVYMGNPEGMSTAVSGDTGFFAAVPGVLTALDLSSGDFLWNSRFERSAAGKLPEVSVSGNTVFVFSGNSLSRFNLNGTETGGRIDGIKAFCTAGDNQFYTVADDNTVYAYENTSEKAFSKAELPEGITSLLFSSGKLHASVESGKYIVLRTDAFTRAE